MSLVTPLRFSLLSCLAVFAASTALAQTNPPVTTYDSPNQHVLPNGQPDSGTTTTDASGATTTTYQDGWTKRTEPDNTFTPPGTKITIKDKEGRIREIIKADSTLTWRHQTLIDPTTFTTTRNNWRADGSIIDGTREVDDPSNPPKKVERWNPERGKYEPVSSNASLHFSGPALALAAVLFVLGLLLGRAWGMRSSAAIR